MRILLIDDDEVFSNLLKAKLTEQRYIVDTAANGIEGWDLVEATHYDLIVLDVVLPLDGISFCRRLRASCLQVLVLLLSARGTSDDKVIGLNAGADDYVVKPVPLPELEARIRALLRRKATTVSSILEWGFLRLDPNAVEVTYGGSVALNLTAKEFALLELFMRNPQKIHSQNSILNQLWSLDDDLPSGDTVRALVKRLRQKLKAVGSADLIETVYGVGYRLNPAFPKTLVTDDTSSSFKKSNIQGRNQSITTNNSNQTLKPTNTKFAKVMVVDDDRISLKLVRTLLEPWGLQVTCLNNPSQLWDELEAFSPDLLILDVQMPDIDGIELCQMLRNDSRFCCLPILFLTQHRDPDIIQQVFVAGADDFVSKPVVASELITRIFNRLERTRLLRKSSS